MEMAQNVLFSIILTIKLSISLIINLFKPHTMQIFTMILMIISLIPAWIVFTISFLIKRLYEGAKKGWLVL